VAWWPAAHRQRGHGEVYGKTIYEVQPSCHYTGGELRTAENGGVNEGNRRENGEELLDTILQLQRKKEHMRRRPTQATGDEWHGGELSPVDGGQRRCDLRWRPEEWSPSYKNQGKRSVRSWRNSMHEELMNGARSRWLAGG
jgi:hypothetical protein